MSVGYGVIYILGPCSQLKKSQKQLENKESEKVCIFQFMPVVILSVLFIVDYKE
jgi:hypothetical protein